MQGIVILGPLKVLFYVMAPLVVLSCSDLNEYDSRQVKLALGDSLFNSTESWGFSMNTIEGGIVRMNMNGSYSYNIQQNGENQTHIKGPVSIKIFNEEGKLESTVECDSAFYEPDLGHFQMFGNVHVTTVDGKNLRSEFLLWERNIDKVSTPEFVIFISPPDSIAANGFYGNSDLTNYTLNEGGGKVVID